MPRYDFTAGQILTAAQMDALSDQTVMRFAGTAARGSAIPSPTEGMTTYLDDLNRIEVYSGSAWRAVGTILQVVETRKVNAFTTTSTTYVDVTDLSVSITPSSATSKILVLANVAQGHSLSGGGQNFAQILRDSTAIGNASSGHSILLETPTDGNRMIVIGTVSILDSPNTTSAITYKVQLKTSPSGTAYLNRNVDSRLSTSSITVFEVAP